MFEFEVELIRREVAVFDVLIVLNTDLRWLANSVIATPACR